MKHGTAEAYGSVKSSRVKKTKPYGPNDTLSRGAQQSVFGTNGVIVCKCRLTEVACVRNSVYGSADVPDN